MSYPIDPAGSNPQPNPVGTQEQPAGDFKAFSQGLHEAALNREDIQEALENKELQANVKQIMEDMFAVTDAWKPKNIIKFIIDCPSGQRCLAKHLDTMDLIGADIIEEIDFFTKKLFPNELDAQGNPVERTVEDAEASIWGVLRDLDKRKRFFGLLNSLLTIGIVKPKVIDDGVVRYIDETGTETVAYGSQLTPEEQLELLGHKIPALKSGEVYGGAIDFADKMTIFAELNKPLALIQPFRQEQDVMLASMEPVQSVESQT